MLYDIIYYILTIQLGKIKYFFKLLLMSKKFSIIFTEKNLHISGHVQFESMFSRVNNIYKYQIIMLYT